jgi:heterodisulfide reductase subunit A2
MWPERVEGKVIMDRMIAEVAGRENIRVFTSTTISNFEGFFGNYQATLDTPLGEERITAGGIIVAIGFSPFDPRIKPELGYGKDDRIMTTLEFETRKETLKENPRVAILHCVGSRDEQINRPYCSRVCCINALKTADTIKDKYKDSYVESFYMDVRAHPRGGEEFFEDTQEKGVLFTRSNIAEIIPTPEALLVRGEDTLLGELFEREFDYVVLSIGMSPPEDSKLISTLLKVTLDKDKFFLEAHIKLRPFDTAVKGIFIAGSCSGPKDMEESINHGRASALKLYGFLNLGYAFVDPFISWVDPKRCSGCRMCEKACVAKAIKFDEVERVAHVEEAACMGCGLCNATCPSSSISLKGHRDSYIDDEIGAILEAVV